MFRRICVLYTTGIYEKACMGKVKNAYSSLVGKPEG